MKTRNLKKALTVFTVLVMLISLITMGNTAVYAAAAPATNLRWDGNTARWDAPVSGDVANYNLIVFKNDEFAEIFTPMETYVDLTKTLLGNGTGDYTFAVLVCFKNGEASAQAKSDVLKYTSTHVHNGVLHSFQYPTCTEMGNKEYYECEECGKWFWDSKCKYEVESKMEIMLEAYGHDWGEWEVTKEPTATENGIETRVCNNDPDHIETREIPAIGEGASSAQTSEPESVPESSEPVSEVVSDIPSEVESVVEPESSEVTSEEESEAPSEVIVEPATKDDAESKDDTSSLTSSKEKDDGKFEIKFRVKPLTLVIIVIAAVIVISIIILIIIAVTRKKSGTDEEYQKINMNE